MVVVYNVGYGVVENFLVDSSLSSPSTPVYLNLFGFG